MRVRLRKVIRGGVRIAIDNRGDSLMTGLLGVLSAAHASDTISRFNAAVEIMKQRNCRISSSIQTHDGRGLFGAFESVGSAILAEQRVNQLEPCAFIHGVLYNVDEKIEETSRRQTLQENRGSSFVLRLYEEHGADFAKYLEGEFSVAVVDPSRHRILIATDTIGSHPVYWRQDSNGMAFCSNLSALLGATPSVHRLDLRAVADYVTLGSLLADRTLVRGVSLLPPGTLMEYDTRSQVASLRQYSDIEEFFSHNYRDKNEYFESVDAEFKLAVQRSLKSSRRVGLALSGGLDSRAILSACGDRARTLQTYTLGISGCADQVISEELSRIAGSQHSFFCLDQRYLRDFLPNMARMVSATDGMYVSHGLTEMLALQFLSETGIEILLRGHGGELAKARLAWPLHTDDRVYQVQSSDQLADYLSERANYITRGLDLSSIFVPEVIDAAGDGSRSSFRALLANTALSPADCCSYLYLRELTRRFTIPSIELFRTVVEVRLPYLDRRFLRALLAAPSEWRDGTEIHQRLIASGISKLVKVRNSNTGAPADASSGVEYVLDKFNSVMKRINMRGYRHYHNFDAWMKTMLLQSVESELLSSKSITQEFIRKTVLVKIIEETKAGQRDWGYLLQILLILEIWQRENRVSVGIG